MNSSYQFFATPGSPYTIEARVTAPDDGQQGRHSAAAYAWHWLGRGDDYEANRSDADQALKYSYVWACVQFIAQSLAAPSWHVYELSEDGRSRMPIEDNEAWLLDLQFNPEMTAFAGREVLLKHALTAGNGYAEIERTGAGRPQWLWPISSDRVCPDRTESGQLIYEVENGTGVKNTILLPSQMFHVKGMGDDGIVGYSVLEMAARAIKLGTSTEAFGANFFGK
ncbi:MAG: phage portal protein, partial [Pseudomonadota bacterium]